MGSALLNVLSRKFNLASNSAFIGSLFELTGGNDPNLGFATTAGIALVSVPLGVFLFYASILKATAETEEDDRDYMKKP